MRVPLYVLTDAKYGGWISYTAHLAAGLEQAGHEPIIVRIGKRSNMNPRPFAFGYSAITLNAPGMIEFARLYKGVITCLAYSKHETLAEQLLTLLPVVIHDPTEYSNRNTGIMRYLHQQPVITIRASVCGALNELSVPAQYIPHPYAPAFMGDTIRAGAISHSRLDWDKHTEIIIAANAKLTTPIDIYGALNRIYEYHELRKVDPDWKRFYKGAFTVPPVGLLHGYNWSVDMSAIAGDGGGTQYTFFEAWDAGCGLVLNERWFDMPGELEPGIHCVTANDADSLADAVKQPVPKAMLDAGRAMIADHDAATIARQLLATL